ncbi:hypothetical protein LTS08_001569 [Lithohypha guttulata]|uniref:uncharacterized protein n=1 Tax=Lithohypha guttulata TaxID=1690604 RepID=UPI002DDFE23A|nr:hypothetical protein LTR51_003763 [Lithohypha guttulata]KAK5105292.1 hypothetical protein LTS08_001569 [Lithohypha guttulata]
MAAAIIPEGIQDDKAQHVVPFILDLLHQHEAKHASSKPFTPVPPLIVGLTAPQGAGKSLLVSLLHKSLTSTPHYLLTTIFSLDDFYLPHDGLQSLARANLENPLLQHRGQPSTHDIPLVRSVFASLRENKSTKIPQFNKAAYNGQGDRVPESDWLEVNTESANPVRIVLFEGWCVGFRPISDEAVKQKHEAASKLAQEPDSNYKGRLGHNALQNLSTINNSLKQYDEITSQFDGLIHIDAEDPLFVYEWRQEQEHNMIKAKGSGMTDEEVKNFVDGYYPSYELYVDGMRAGVFKTLAQDGLREEQDVQSRQLRLIVGKDRKVKKVERI